MARWVVMLKTAEGTQTLTLEADVAERSDDGKEVSFSSFASLVDAFLTFEKLQGDLSREQTVEEFKKLLKALSKLSVGSFKADLVLGYYQAEDDQSLG